MNGITDVHVHESRGKVGVFNAVITRAQSVNPGSVCDYGIGQDQYAYDVIHHAFIFIQLWELRLRLCVSN